MAYINGHKLLSVVQTVGVPIPNLQNKTVTPTTASQNITYDAGYGGLDTVAVEAVTNSIDVNIQAENIREGISILGVTGTFEGASPIQPKDVNFYDYDGTLIVSYTLAEANALTALPPAPNHSDDEIPLTFDGWNWELENIQTLTAPANIGANYVTTDSLKTYFKIEIFESTTIAFYISNGASTIDWGDGTTTTAINSSSTQNTHTYTTAGVYFITITKNGSSNLELGTGYRTTLGIGSNYGLRAVYLGRKVYINGRIFSNSYGLQKISIANDTRLYTSDSYSNNFFVDNHQLQCLVIPSTFNINNATNTFSNCYNCLIINSRADNGTLGNNTFARTKTQIFNFSKYIAIPTISSSTFNTCDLKAIYVPLALYDSWVVATNWSMYSDYIIGV